MNKFLKNFLCNEIARQTKKETEKQFPNHSWGEIKLITFISTDGKEIKQKMTYDNYEGEKVLNEEEAKKFKKLFKGFDLEKEFAGNGRFGKKVKMILAGIFVKEKDIKIVYHFTDGTKQNITF